MLIGCFFQSNCDAAGIYNVKYDADCKNAIISGNIAQLNVNVTLEVLKQGNQSDVLKNFCPCFFDWHDAVIVRSNFRCFNWFLYNSICILIYSTKK